MAYLLKSPLRRQSKVGRGHAWREAHRAVLQLRQTRRLVQILAVAILSGLAAAYYARLFDLAIRWHQTMYRAAPWAVLLAMPFGFGFVTWATRRFAPAATGSGIPQVIAAAESRWTGRWGGQRVTLRTAAWKVVLSVVSLLFGASIGREGPTVQVVAGLMRSLTRGLKGEPGRRALILAGGAAGVAAAFNAPIAGVIFAVEELAGAFEKRTHATVILVVVTAGFASYALQGDYAYFGVFDSGPVSPTIWLAAPMIGIVGGLAGGAFSRLLAICIGPGSNPLNDFRRARPVTFAVICGAIAAVAAWASGGITFGAGYAEAKSLLTDHPGRGFSLAISKFIATLAASAAGGPGGLFAPSLATGAGIGGAFARSGLFAFQGRDAVVIGMAAYLSGVVQAPLTSAVILMEMTRSPGLVGPLLVSTLLARWVSGRINAEPIYHLLAHGWMGPGPEHGAVGATAGKAPVEDEGPPKV